MTTSRYDPIPDLAALIDGLQRTVATGNSDGIFSGLRDLLAGPYARLRGGLLLDESSWEDASTANALRDTLRELDPAAFLSHRGEQP